MHCRDEVVPGTISFLLYLLKLQTPAVRRLFCKSYVLSCLLCFVLTQGHTAQPWLAWNPHQWCDMDHNIWKCLFYQASGNFISIFFLVSHTLNNKCSTGICCMYIHCDKATTLGSSYQGQKESYEVETVIPIDKF